MGAQDGRMRECSYGLSACVDHVYDVEREVDEIRTSRAGGADDVTGGGVGQAGERSRALDARIDCREQRGGG